jgi:hypothetical protein
MFGLPMELVMIVLGALGAYFLPKIVPTPKPAPTPTPAPVDPVNPAPVDRPILDAARKILLDMLKDLLSPRMTVEQEIKAHLVELVKANKEVE